MWYMRFSLAYFLAFNLIICDGVCISNVLNHTTIIPLCNFNTSKRLNILDSTNILRKRRSVKEFVVPYVEVAFVFFDTDPDYAISTPLFIGQGHISKMMESIWEKTSGLWAWDIVIDSSPDNSREVVIKTLLKFSLSFSQSKVCKGTCSHGSGKRESNRFTSFPTYIRVINAPWPVWETKADNTVFSDNLYQHASFLVSVQADQAVLEQGWNLFLSIPIMVWPRDVISVSCSCAENLQCTTSGRQPMYDQIGTACNSKGLRSISMDSTATSRRRDFGGQAAEVFHVRDSSTRGPLLFHHEKVRELGYFDEVSFILGNDDHDLHMRARDRYVTGFYPILWRNIKRNRTKEFLLKKRFMLENREARYRKEQVMSSFLENRDGGRQGVPLLHNRPMSSADSCRLHPRTNALNEKKRVLSKNMISTAIENFEEKLSHRAKSLCAC